MQSGDLIAFGGGGYVSKIIKTATNSPVSHVGVILQTNIPTIEGILINQIIESVGKKKSGEAGVIINRMSDHIKEYDGSIWWLPLSKKTRSFFDQAMFFSFLLDQVGKEYDTPQAIGSALDFIPANREDLDKLFCSELVTAAFKWVGVIDNLNASEQTPADVCAFPIYGEAYQLKGIKSDLV